MPTATAGPEVVELRPESGPARKAPWREGGLWLLAAGLMLFIGILKGINLVIVLAYLLGGLWVINLLLGARPSGTFGSPSAAAADSGRHPG